MFKMQLPYYYRNKIERPFVVVANKLLKYLFAFLIIVELGMLSSCVLLLRNPRHDRAGIIIEHNDRGEHHDRENHRGHRD